MKQQRTERLGAEILTILGELLARGEVKDRRVQGAGIVTLTRVRVTGDLREARVAFTVYGADDRALERVRAGLTSAASFLQREVGHRLRVRHTPALEFEIDRAFDQAFKVDALLREVAAEAGGGASAEASGGGGGEDGDEDEDEDEDGEKRDSGDR